MFPQTEIQKGKDCEIYMMNSNEQILANTPSPKKNESLQEKIEGVTEVCLPRGSLSRYIVTRCIPYAAVGSGCIAGVLFGLKHGTSYIIKPAGHFLADYFKGELHEQSHNKNDINAGIDDFLVGLLAVAGIVVAASIFACIMSDQHRSWKNHELKAKEAQQYRRDVTAGKQQ